jgi:xanthine dehydrogenase accessory factor
MRDVLETLLEKLSLGQDVAYCRLVETRGSTPRKAGAAMLVYRNGTQYGTLGGGCVEAATKRHALQALAEQNTRLIPFDLDHEEGWNDGLICGGRMVVRIESLRGDADPQYLRHYVERLRSGATVTEAVVCDEVTSGLPAALTCLFDSEGRYVAGHPLPIEEVALARIRAALLPVSSRARPYTAGGIAYLPNPPHCRLLIVGGGHVGQAVAELASNLDFEIWVIDDRAEYVSPERFPTVARRIVGAFESTLRDLEITTDTYCIIVTRGHTHDQQALYHLVDRGARYVGMIGSRRKIQLVFDNLRCAGIAAESLARVYAPLGIEIGSQTVAEISLSICAELVAHRNRAGCVPGKEPRELRALVSP